MELSKGIYGKIEAQQLKSKVYFTPIREEDREEAREPVLLPEPQLQLLAQA